MEENMTEDKREKIKKLIYDFLTIVDVNSKFKNRTYYQDLFNSLSGKEFDE
jgi:hypothetical protein